MYNGSDYLVRKVVINNKCSFDIENENLAYATFGETHHGLQTIFDADSEEYKEIMAHCSEIINNIKEIDKIIYNK